MSRNNDNYFESQSDFVADVMKFYTSDYQCFEGDFNSTRYREKKNQKKKLRAEKNKIVSILNLYFFYLFSVFKETSDHDPETTHVEGFFKK